MLQLSNSLLNIPVMSLRTGGKVATAEKPIINPNNLKIEGWYCIDHFNKQTLVLLSKDIREIVPQGLAIDDYDRLSEPDELIRIQEILRLNFEILGKAAVTDQKRKLGKVSDYALDTNSFYIQKIYISQPLYKSMSNGQLSIDRSQIVEITDKRIVVKDVDVKVGSPVTALLGIRT